MTKVIGDYTAAAAIDGSTHYLLIQPGNASTAYNRINRNVFLGVTGQPADISTTQSLTNKTLDNSNIATLRDDRFTLQDNLDTTKQAQFQLSGITTATTRTYTLPNASSTLADISTAQTFTNKTLTAPVISGGSMSNITITVDAINEFTAANGVTIDGLNIKDGALNTNNSVVTTNITDSAVTPNKLLSGTGASWTWQTWVPTFTNLSGGTLNYARYCRIGKTIQFRLRYTLGGAGVAGLIGFTLPVNFNADYSVASDTINAFGQIRDASTGDVFIPWVIWGSSSRADVYFANAGANLQSTSSTAPFIFAVNDVIMIIGEYEGV